MSKEYSVGDNERAILLADENGEGPVVCTWGMGVQYDEEGVEHPRRCLTKLTEAGVRREPGEPFPFPETGTPDCDEDNKGKPAVDARRQFLCSKHGIVDTFSTIVLVEDLAALEPLWVEASP